MKKAILTGVILLYSISIMAQAPQSFSYQAVARDLSGNVLANKGVSFKISILSGSATGTVVYNESHSASTNEYGLVELQIGKGIPVTGTFSSISWGTTALYMKTEMDPAGGTAYQNLGTSQILSVPYALHAKSVETGDQWGSQSVVANTTLSGNGTTATPLKVADGGITSLQIADGTITGADLANLTITTDKIATSAVTAAKLNQSGAAEGQVLKWVDKSWVPANDLTGTGGTAGGDLTGTYPNPLIADGKVSSAKILDGTIATADLADDAVTGAKIAGMSATDRQVLRYFGKLGIWGPDTVSDLIAAGSVTEIELAPAAVTESKLATGAVTAAKLG